MFANSQNYSQYSHHPDTIEAIFQKAGHVSAVHEKQGLRKDPCGAWIKRAHYGRRDSNFGWEIDHIVPVVKGGSDDVKNLQPLHWKNNVSKSSGEMICNITSWNDGNIAI